MPAITKEQVKLYMQEHGLTYRAMADRFSVGMDTVVRWRRSGISESRINTAIAIVSISAYYGDMPK